MMLLVFIHSGEKNLFHNIAREKGLLMEIQFAQTTKKRITRKTSQSGMFIE